MSDGEWSSGLCDCKEDRSNCCVTCFFPCITFGQIAEIVDEGYPPCFVSGGMYGLLCFTGFAYCYACMYRTKMRRKFNMPDEIDEVKHSSIKRSNGQWVTHEQEQSYTTYDRSGDCLIHWCCNRCALCQEYRELKDRGFDPALGWKKNLQKEEHEMAPPANPTMER
ncbi:hypothetical protein SUGI_1054930 [Cryptomeria japonica]|nr:hypothetical protein SUGI_1054930 [Cryptomeria japonica]